MTEPVKFYNVPVLVGYDGGALQPKEIKFERDAYYNICFGSSAYVISPDELEDSFQIIKGFGDNASYEEQMVINEKYEEYLNAIADNDGEEGISMRDIKMATTENFGIQGLTIEKSNTKNKYKHEIICKDEKDKTVFTITVTDKNFM